MTYLVEYSVCAAFLYAFWWMSGGGELAWFSIAGAYLVGIAQSLWDSFRIYKESQCTR